MFVSHFQLQVSYIDYCFFYPFIFSLRFVLKASMVVIHSSVKGLSPNNGFQQENTLDKSIRLVKNVINNSCLKDQNYCTYGKSFQMN